MDTEKIKESIVTKVHSLTAETKVPLHKHDDKDEIFYVLKGEGFGVLESGETNLTCGKEFIVKAGGMASLKTEKGLGGASFLISRPK